MDISGNKLSGALPACVTNITKLEVLRVAFNKLDGELPRDIDRMTRLRELDLSHNKLRGRAPVGLGKIARQLTTARVDFNHLSCDLPREVQHWEQPVNGSDSVRVLTGNRFGCPIPRAQTCGAFAQLFSCPVAGLALADAGASVPGTAWHAAAGQAEERGAQLRT